MSSDEQKCVFGIGLCPDGVPLIVMGIPRAAWVHMKDGRSHEFDFAKAGHNFRLLLFGGKDHAECFDTITKATAAAGQDLKDEREKDFTFNDLKGKNDG